MPRGGLNHNDVLLVFINPPGAYRRGGLMKTFHRLIALGPNKPEWFDEECVTDFRKIHISEGFQYLGLTNSNSLIQLNSNFPREPNLVNQILQTQTHRKTTLSGGILKVRQLVCSTFVYQFQLIPTPVMVLWSRSIDRYKIMFGKTEGIICRRKFCLSWLTGVALTWSTSLFKICP